MTRKLAFRPRFTTASVAGLAVALGLAGCAAEALDDAEQVEQDLELDNGGLDMEDEAPMFGSPDLFAEAELAEEVLVEDAIEQDTEVVAMLGQPDAVLYHTTVLWGQFPADAELASPRNWSGRIEVSRGALIVRSTIRFEGQTDRLLPRDNPRRVDFRSATLPHRDGLRLTIVDPTPEADEPLFVRYIDTDEGVLFARPMAALVDGPETEVLDADDNRIVALSMRQPREACSHGFMQGRWYKVGPRHGRMIGRVVNGEGELVGHVRGIWGQRRGGNEVFFGKYINRAGEFMGIFRGTYGEGHYEGRWLHRGGDHGALGGHYRETLPGPRVGGHFLGRWAETRCNVPPAS